MSVRLSLVWAVTSLVVCWSLVLGVGAELYTCLADMEELLETEALLMQTLDGYIQAQEEKLQMLRRLVNVHCDRDRLKCVIVTVSDRDRLKCVIVTVSDRDRLKCVIVTAHWALLSGL